MIVPCRSYVVDAQLTGYRRGAIENDRLRIGWKVGVSLRKPGGGSSSFLAIALYIPHAHIHASCRHSCGKATNFSGCQMAIRAVGLCIAYVLISQNYI